MLPEFSIDQYRKTASWILEHTPHRPTIGMFLGSGLNPLAEQIQNPTIIPYENIPNFPVSTVHGHAGRLVIGDLAGVNVCAMQGRFHYYEGYSMAQVTLPVRVMKLMEIGTLILTNAAGGLHEDYAVGDLMLIEDHLNLVGIGGNNPLRGPNIDAFGTRFPPMNRTYTRELRSLAQQIGSKLGLSLHSGVYAGLAGPNFESPAEIRYLRTIGADAVGMSTVPEAIVAHHAGLDLLGISTITNICIDQLDSGTEPTHEEVNEAGKLIVPRLTQLLLGLLAQLGKSN